MMVHLTSIDQVINIRNISSVLIYYLVDLPLTIELCCIMFDLLNIHILATVYTQITRYGPGKLHDVTLF